MEKKAVKKASVKKKAAVEENEIKPISPWTEVAADVLVPPAAAGDLTSSAKSTGPKKAKTAPKATAAAMPVPPVVARGTSTIAKPARSKKTKASPKAAAVDMSVPSAVAGGSTSSVKPSRSKKSVALKTPTLNATAEIAAAEPKVELSPVFKALAEPKLPVLTRENRARLMMQTPTSLYFYWSVRENPYQLLRKMFGDDLGSYTLVLKLTELNSGVEKIHRAEAEGNWWFDVEPGGKYEAEIGFYAPNRPYFRVIYSNTIETPRRNPSPRQATDADWRIPAHKFAAVLDVAGFSQDAFDVAMAGDDHETAEQVTHTAFHSFMGTDGSDLRGIAAEDIRYSLMALAAGTRLEDLRSRVSPALFAILQANAGSIVGQNAMSVLTEYFDIDEAEFTEHETGSAVYGASLVNFPRTLRTVASSRLPVVSSSSMTRIRPLNN